MTPFTRAFLWGAAAIVVYDALGSLASRELGFPYPALAIGSVLIYGAVGAYVGARERVRHAARAGFAVGVVDATIGWAISWMIGPGRPAEGDPSGLPYMLVGGITAILLAVGTSALGGWIGSRRRAAYEKRASA
jgi:hypothetical protein